VADRYEDERGVIQDLFGAVDGITKITTKAGAVRGNHVHPDTTQWTYIVRGRMLFRWVEADGVITDEIHGTDELIEEPAGCPHAWQAIEDSTVLVITRGPRSGEGFEAGTRRLEVPILL